MNGKTVLFLTYWYPNKNNKSFGIFVKRHAHAIKVNNDLVILSLNIAKANTFYKKSVVVFQDEMNVETHQIYLESTYNKLLYVLLPLHYLVLKKYIRKQILPNKKIEVIHTNVLFPCSVTGYWLAKKFGFKQVITEHWSKLDKFFKVSLYKFAGRKALNSANAITCVSGQLKTVLQKYTSNTVHIVPNVVDSKEFYYDTGIKKNDTFTFVAAAHWAKPKNPFYFLDALSQLFEENKLPKFKVVLAGEGEQLGEIKQRHYAFEIDYKGQLNAAQLNNELNKSHVLLHGSDFETFSVIIAEGLICGLPGIVSPVGISREVINPQTGFIAGNTVSDWKEKILACYNTTYSNVEIAQQLKGKYDQQTVGGLFSELYK